MCQNLGNWFRHFEDISKRSEHLYVVPTVLAHPVGRVTKITSTQYNMHDCDNFNSIVFLHCLHSL